ncbi:NADH:flavin oxidoreductase [Falsigemmobacter faecalis]|uniref:NADH:flavin oxidoreductase n=1 Tax=Falsigemmobacter faecalis TaxID=2488730 RepID=A0A3P3DZF6_9RHOB|nr:NADH:flavin oxidoreductase [Falsigemmobacter faecalis]RRH78238.1 NADH:flavin oxidoreductase [Falsigemmobacter faecalis]
MTETAFQPLTLRNGVTWENRITLAPLTNRQSHEDGVLSDDEIRWLEARGEGGFSMVMTAAAYVQRDGQSFEGQLGAATDLHDAGLAELAARLKASGTQSALQLQHGGNRSRPELSGLPMISAVEGRGARDMSGAEVEALRDTFIASALRAQKAGFDGVEVHGAHGYLLTQFLSDQNTRSDIWGGSYDNRTRLVREIVSGIRKACGADFTLGLRLSPERYGIALEEAQRFATEMMTGGDLEYLDVSLWDYAKAPEDTGTGRLLDAFMDLPRGTCALGVAGKIYAAADVRACLSAGADFVLIGRGGILHADFPQAMAADAGFRARDLPVTAEYLRSQALGERFVSYMATVWPGFVEG